MGFKGHRERGTMDRAWKVREGEERKKKKQKSDQLDANEMPRFSARDIWGGLTRRALL